MTKRIILAGVLGAIAMFIWTAIAHMLLPLGEAGIGEVPNDEALLKAMETSAGAKSGLYIFPGMGLGPDATHAQRSDEGLRGQAGEESIGPADVSSCGDATDEHA
jgi:hypothetical protein